jgi:dUTP pyrophosphatase
MTVPIKFRGLHPDFKLPILATPGSGAWDLFTPRDWTVLNGSVDTIPLGFAVEIPVGYRMQLCDRSGLARKKGLHVLAGLIDSDYRDEVGVVLANFGPIPAYFLKNDRICQFKIEKIESISIFSSSILSETSRKGGFGSTGA